MTERYIAGHGSHKTIDGVEHHWYLNTGWQPCPGPEPAAPPPAPTDDNPLHATNLPRDVRPRFEDDAPTDDVAASYFDTLRGSITDPDVLAAAAKAEADRPAPTDDVAALVARLRSKSFDDPRSMFSQAADALERLAADLAAALRRYDEQALRTATREAVLEGDLAAARAEAEQWKADALRMERELELSGEDRVAAEDEADALRRQVAAVRALCDKAEARSSLLPSLFPHEIRDALDTEEPP